MTLNDKNATIVIFSLTTKLRSSNIIISTCFLITILTEKGKIPTKIDPGQFDHSGFSSIKISITHFSYIRSRG